MEFPLSGGFYESDSLPISAQQCTNLRVNIPQTEGALSQAQLFGTEGLEQIQISGTVNSFNRGSGDKAELPYFLNGDTLFRLDRTVDGFGVETFTLVTLGVITGLKRASFASNGTQLMVVTDGDGWIIDESSGTPFQIITDAGFKANGVPQQVDFVDSFFVVTTDSRKFIRSDANNGLSWSALNVFTAEADPDPIVAPIVFKNELYIGGGVTIEAFRDVAGEFQRTGLIINKGIFSPFGIAKTSDSFMFIGGGKGETPAVWEFIGNTTRKVSTTAIDTVLSKFSIEDIEAAFTYSYAQSGAYIIGFTFPERTFEYNTVTQLWNERKSQIVDARGQTLTTRFRVNSLVKAFNRIICGDSIDGRIGVLDPDFLDEYGTEIVRVFTTQPFANQGRSFSITKLEATMESGVGSDTEPQIRLSVSKDAKKFNNELSRGFGKVGEFDRRVIWRLLGRFPRYAILKFETAAKVKVVFIKLDAEMRGGNVN